MEYQRFGNTIMIRMDPQEEIMEQVMEVVKAEKIKLASIQALGAINHLKVGVFNTVEKKYYGNVYDGPFEIVSLHGTVTTMNGEPYLHLHMSAGDEEGHVFGGHLNEAVVSATCEMVMTVMDGVVEREHSDTIGLNLFKFK